MYTYIQIYISIYRILYYIYYNIRYIDIYTISHIVYIETERETEISYGQMQYNYLP